MARQIVLVRAYGEEALRRVIISHEGRLIFIAAETSLGRLEAGETQSVGFPQEDVFVYDSALYESLTKEFDKERRKELWKTALRVSRG